MANPHPPLTVYIENVLAIILKNLFLRSKINKMWMDIWVVIVS